MLQRLRQCIQQSGIWSQWFAEQCCSLERRWIVWVVDGELEQELLSTLLLFLCPSEQNLTDGQGAGGGGGCALEAGFRCTAISKGCESLGERQSIVLVQAIAADPVAGFPELRGSSGPTGAPAG